MNSTVIDAYILAQFVSAGLVFIMLMTKTWKNSVSTFASVVSFFIFMNMMHYGLIDIGLYIYMFVLFVLVIKAILVRRKDVIFDLKSDIFKRKRNV